MDASRAASAVRRAKVNFMPQMVRNLSEMGGGYNWLVSGDVRIMVLKRGENSEHHGSIGSLTFRFLVGGWPTPLKIPLTCSLGCFTKHFIEKIGYKMVLRQPAYRQQVGTLYEMTSPSSLWNASPQTTRVQRHAARHRATTQLSSIKCCSNLKCISTT